MAFTRVEREETPVLFVRARDAGEAIRAAWEQLEQVVPLRGRSFFGSFDPGSGEYRACVVEQEEDDAAALGLERASLPGGAYLRARLRGEPPAVYDRIPGAFDELAAAAAPDPSRPSLEHYRRRDEIDLLLPVR